MQSGSDATQSPSLVALDVGGTSMKGAVVDRQLRRLITRRWPTPRAEEDVVIDAVAGAAVELLEAAGGTATAAGIVVPGLVDEARGRAVLSANLGWCDVPLRDLLTQRLGLPVAFGHDVRSGALAEATLGAAQGVQHAMFVPIGTGVAAALVLDGRPHRGDGEAGEIGHVVVEPAGRRCGCGQRGCLETVASAAAITRRFAARSGAPAAASTVDVARLAQEGERVAVEVWAQAVDALARVLATCVALVAPQRIVVGGGLAQAGGLLIEPLRQRLAHHLAFRATPDVVPSALGDQAACLGAALLARALTVATPK